MPNTGATVAEAVEAFMAEASAAALEATADTTAAAIAVADTTVGTVAAPVRMAEPVGTAGRDLEA